MSGRQNVLAHIRPTAAQVACLLDYDQLTGALTWRSTSKNGNVRQGDLAGHICKRGYRIIRMFGRNYKAHRVAWLLVQGEWPSADIDHINGIRHDNRIQNLRDVARVINQQNYRVATPRSKSGLLGTSYLKGKWKAQIGVFGVQRYLGTFDTPQEAHAAYVAAKRALHPGCTI